MIEVIVASAVIWLVPTSVIVTIARWYRGKYRC
jgi:hypothetical protein